ncbi:hypothetical protein [Streptomyces sp. NBC_00038]|uniref:hypothetical protein n=1 Tax=Streptomyces sp. NBC_00038 TaxID=2903615 RepID=UPI0022557C75|nr:hypothetical protein [Streptomyces sp. NBC_00038]MCX5563375.1 hypothetical protein [Streptomyces sp. NBC_00038]
MFRGFAMPAAAALATTALQGVAAPATAAGAVAAPALGAPQAEGKAASFRSNADTAVYAIDWGRGTCYHRLIRAHDLADSWPWGTRLDGVADTTMNCEVG